MKIDHASIVRRVLRQLEGFPEKHNQRTWSYNWDHDAQLDAKQHEWLTLVDHIRKFGCGTTGCAAGWTIELVTQEEFDWAIAYGPQVISDGAAITSVAAALLGPTFSSDIFFLMDKGTVISYLKEHLEVLENVSDY